MTDARQRIAEYLASMGSFGGTWESYTSEADDILAIVMDTIGHERDLLLAYASSMSRQSIHGDKHYDSFVEEHGDDYEPDWEGGFEAAVREARRLVNSLGKSST